MIRNARDHPLNAAREQSRHHDKGHDPNAVTAIVQKAAAIFPSADSARRKMIASNAIKTAIAIRPMAIFQAGRFSHDRLKAETICAHDQSHRASIVFKNHAKPSRMSRSS